MPYWLKMISHRNNAVVEQFIKVLCGRCIFSRMFASEQNGQREEEQTWKQHMAKINAITTSPARGRI